MNSNSGSVQTTESSLPSQGFICSLCFTGFPSGLALGGHQNSHLIDTSLKLTPTNILASVHNHPLPLVSSESDSSDSSDNDDDEVDGGEFIVDGEEDSDSSLSSDSSTIAGSSSGINTPMTPDTLEFVGDSKIEMSEDDEEERRRNGLTQNLVGEWATHAQLKAREATLRSTQPPTLKMILFPLADLELSLKTSAPFILDLELKLGF